MNEQHDEVTAELQYLLNEGFIKLFEDEHGETRMRLFTDREIQQQIEEIEESE